MAPLRAALVLCLLAAASVPAGTLAAQDDPVRVDPTSLRRLRDGSALVHVTRGTVDTVAAAGRVERLSRGDMLVNITGRAPTRIVSPSTRPDTAPAGPGSRPSADSAADDPAPPSTPGTVPERADRDPVAFDLGYEIGVADGTGDRLRILTPVVEVENGGMRYDPRERAWLGSILIGLVNRDRPADHGALGDSVWVQIAGDIRSVHPVSLDRVNIPFQRVELRVDRPSGDSVRVRLRPTFDPQGVTLSIPVHAARLTVLASPLRIAGLGLEKSQLMLQGAEGDDSIRVMLASVRGNPSPNQLWVTAAGASAALRSVGVGRDTVTVLSGVYRGTAEVHYVWPWSFLLAALFGGLVGGLLNGLPAHRRSNARALALLGLQGALTGMMASVLYAVGINVLGWAPDATYGEALMLGVAFLAGLVGPRIFDRVHPALSVGRGDPPAGDGPSPTSPAAEPTPAG
jgi:hypothetical protein